MSNFTCRDVYALLDQAPPGNLPEIELVDEGVTYDPPQTEELLGAVRQVCGAGWFWALANRMHVTEQLDDIVQTTYLNVWRARNTFNPAYPVACRVARIARNALIDVVRARSRRRAISLFDNDGEQQFDPPDRGHGPVAEAIGREMHERLGMEVENAPEQIKKILTLLDRDMTFEQVATALGKKKSAITSAHHRWKVALLKRMKDEG